MKRDGPWRHVGAFLLAALVFYGQAALPLPDALLFHSGVPHHFTEHVESQGAPCHGSHCLLGYTPAAAQPLPPLQSPVPSTTVPEQPAAGLPNLTPPRLLPRADARPRAPPVTIV